MKKVAYAVSRQTKEGRNQLKGIGYLRYFFDLFSETVLSSPKVRTAIPKQSL